jgi:hypothetical protein
MVETGAGPHTSECIKSKAALVVELLRLQGRACCFDKLQSIQLGSLTVATFPKTPLLII